MDTTEDSDLVLAELDMGPNLRRIGGRGETRGRQLRGQHPEDSNRRQGLLERNARRALHQQRFRRVMEEDRDDTPIPPLPRRLGETVPQRVRALLDSPPPSLEVSIDHSWNPNDRYDRIYPILHFKISFSSLNVILKTEDPLVMRRRPVAQSTDCVRAKVGYSEGISNIA